MTSSATICGLCDETYDSADAGANDRHRHPDPQSGPERAAFLASRLPYWRWVTETREGAAWLALDPVRNRPTIPATVTPIASGDILRAREEERERIADLIDSVAIALELRDTPGLEKQSRSAQAAFTSIRAAIAAWTKELAERIRRGD